MNHGLTIESNFYTGGYSGYCSCLDPDLHDEGWEGYSWFEGMTQQEVFDLHAGHVAEVTE